MVRGKFVVGWSVLGFLVIPYLAFTQEPERGVTNSTVRIGIVSPLSGPASSMGSNFQDGLETFFDHVNNMGGIHGRSIILVAEDGKGQPDYGVAAARRMLAGKGVFAFASTSGAPTTRTLIDQGVLSEDIPVLASTALSKSLFSTFRKNLFFLGMPYGDQITMAIEYVLKRRPGVNPKMGLLYRDGFLGEEVREGFHRACGRYRLQIVSEERYSQDIDDFGPIVDRLRLAQADHVVLGTSAGEAAQIMGSARALAWSPQFMGPSSTAELGILIEAGEGADNYLVVDYLAQSWERVPGVAVMRGNTQKYYPRKDPDGLARYHVLGYVSGLLVAEALEGSGMTLTREGFIHALESIHSLNTHGLAGVIGYDTNSRLSDSRGRLFHFDSAARRLLPLTDWSQALIKAGQ